MAIDTTKKIKQVTYNGTEIPLRGYDTSDATVTAGDMARNVIAYGKNGKVTGTLPSVSTVFADATSMSKIGNVIEIDAQTTLAKRILKQNPTISITATPSDFGDATAADVAKGKTFTSAAGLKVTGTAEGSSARPVSIAIENTDFTEVWVAYVPFSGNMTSGVIAQGEKIWVSVEEGSEIVVVNTAFDGGQIALVPNGGFITQTASRENAIAFIVDYSLSSKIVELLLE